MALTEAVWRCSGKKLLLKFTQNYRENTCVGDSFSGRPATLLERDSNTGVFMWILGHFEEHLWTTAFASRILHSSKQHYGSRCQIKQNSNKRTKKYSLKLRGSPAHIPDQKQKNMRQILFFNKVTGLRSATLLKKGLWQRCLPAKFEKFLRTPFYKEQFR